MITLKFTLFFIFSRNETITLKDKFWTEFGLDPIKDLFMLNISLVSEFSEELLILIGEKWLAPSITKNLFNGFELADKNNLNESELILLELYSDKKIDDKKDIML